MPGGPWIVEFHPEAERWAISLVQDDKEALLAAVNILRESGPTLGRPLVDTIKTSRHQNMKELRPGSTGRTKIRVLFAFDTARSAILLLGGDKAGNWETWYSVNIPIADQRFDAHQASIACDQPIAKRKKKGKKR